MLHVCLAAKLNPITVDALPFLDKPRLARSSAFALLRVLALLVWVLLFHLFKRLVTSLSCKLLQELGQLLIDDSLFFLFVKEDGVLEESHEDVLRLEMLGPVVAQLDVFIVDLLEFNQSQVRSRQKESS